jgi:hypothetical protein
MIHVCIVYIFVDYVLLLQSALKLTTVTTVDVQAQETTSVCIVTGRWQRGITIELTHPSPATKRNVNVSSYTRSSVFIACNVNIADCRP